MASAICFLYYCSWGIPSIAFFWRGRAGMPAGKKNFRISIKKIRNKVTLLGLGVVVLITWVLFWGWATEIIRTWFPFMQFDRSLADLCFDR